MNNKVIWLLVAIAVVAVGVLLLTSGGGPDQAPTDTSQEQSVDQEQDQQATDSEQQEETASSDQPSETSEEDDEQMADETTTSDEQEQPADGSQDEQTGDEGDHSADDAADAEDESAQDDAESGTSSADEGEQVTETTEPGDEQETAEESADGQEQTASETQATETASASTGQLVDQVTIIEESDVARAVDRMEANEVQVYAAGTSEPSIRDEVRASENLASYTSYGSYSELTFNPVGPTFETGGFNPFSNKRIREAMNWLIDREYVASELYGGLAQPRYTALTTAFPDYARLVDVARQLEIEYSYDMDQAEQVIADEMQSMGAELVDGTWHYEGEPVTLKFLIRTEDERREVGDYVSNQLEEIGFQVDRQYKTSAEAGPIWIGSNPAKGEWHIYTGGWITTVVSRDQAANFDYFYTPRGRTDPLWQAYQPSEEFDQVSDRLAQRDYATVVERNEMMGRALRLAMENSARVWLVDTVDISPHRQEVSLSSDLAGGVNGSYLWAYTLRSQGRTQVTFATPSILTGPWNPLGGSNWIYDTMIKRALAELPYMPDPYTGLYRPQRIERAEVIAKEGLPIRSSLDWVDLSFQAEIEVPEDAWIDWDAESQSFITVGEKHPDGLTARTKSVIYYDENLFDMTWHDGTEISYADALMAFIIGNFDVAKEASPIYDESQVPAFQQFQEYFKGVRVIQRDPLVVEVYRNLVYLDAESIAAFASAYFFPYYGFGPAAPWHMLAPGIRAEANGELAFSEDKADKNDIETTNYVGGPSLEILNDHLQAAIDEGYIPYENVLAEYVNEEQARSRYQRLQAWYEEHGHFWVGQGPYYLDSVNAVEGVVSLKRNGEFPDSPDKWMRFSKPRIADVSVSGPERVIGGEPAEMTVDVRFEGEPYPIDDVDVVKYLVFDGQGNMLFQGDAEAISDGTWRVEFSAEQTEQLQTGTNRLEVAVVPTVVSKPSFARYTFISVTSQ